MTDLEIAHATPLLPIRDVAAQIGIDENDLEQHGKYIAKVPLRLIDETQAHKSRLILVTSISATRAGIGKTTVSIGLALGLNRIGRKTVVALREPSLGPCFGMKGGAAGGGHAQVLPMEKINLHFTGDFHAITAAHNMIAALLDNYLYQHRAKASDSKKCSGDACSTSTTVRSAASSPDSAPRSTASPRRRVSTSPPPANSWPSSAWRPTKPTCADALRTFSSVTDSTVRPSR